MTYWVALALVLGMTVPALGQDRASSPEGSSRVTWQTERDGVVPWIEGRVFNASPQRVSNVRVEIEGLDRDGRVMRKNVAWTLGDIDPGAETSFRSQPVPEAVDYRMRVLSYDAVTVEAP